MLAYYLSYDIVDHIAMLRNGGIPPVVQLQRTHRFAARKIEWEHQQEEMKLQREREREFRKEMKRQRALQRERERARAKVRILVKWRPLVVRT